MAGLFRKKQYNKPWILSTIQAKDRKFKSRVVKVLCRRSKSVYGSNVMLVSDGETSISAVFSDEAVCGLADQGLGSSNWNTALLILQKYTLELKAQPGQDFGEYILYVKKFSIWDLQPGYQAKYDVKNCMEHESVYDRMKEELKELKERVVPQSESSMTGSVSLSQLLDEIARPSTCESESQKCSEQSQESFTSGSKSHMYSEQNSKCTTDLTESLVDRLMQPFSIEEFLIPTMEVSVLEKIEEWKPDYQPQQVESQPPPSEEQVESPRSPSEEQVESPRSPSEEQVESLIDQQFDVCAANTFSQDHAVRFIATNPEKANCKETGTDVDYLGISFISTPEEKENKEEIVEREPLEPVGALLRLNEVESQSQGTSCLWQEELESVQFSFEQETTAPDSQGSLEKQCRPKITDCSMLKANTKISDRSHRILASENIDMKSTSRFTMPNLKEKSLKCPQLTGTEEEQICIDSSNTSPLEIMQKELLWKRSNEVDLPLQAGKRLKETGTQEVEASRLVSHVNDLLPEGICKATSNKCSVEECLEISSPAAQSTQINDAFHIMPGIEYSLKKSLEKGVAEHLSESLGVIVIESSFGQSEISSQNSGQIYKSGSISQVHNYITETSWDNCFPSEVVSHKTSVKIQTFDKENETKDTHFDNTTNFSSQDVESSVLHNNDIQHSNSPISNLNSVMLQVLEKKKKLAALKYTTERISDVTNKQEKSDGSERFDGQDNIVNNQGEKNTGMMKNGAEVGKEKGMCVKKSENYEINDEERYDMDPENSDENIGKVKQQNAKMIKYVVEIDSKEIELNSCFITSNKDVKKDTHKLMDKNDKVKTQENSVETTETEYPVSSLSDSETFEEGQNDILPPFRVGLSEAHLQKGGLKCKRCEKFKNLSNKKNSDQYSDQTDLEEIDETHQKCIIASSEEEKFEQVCSDKHKASPVEKQRGSLHGFPRAPEYFDTESGCRRRSERLYAKVLSCREKDIQVNGSEVSNTVLGNVFVKNDNRSDINRTEFGDEHVGKCEYDSCVLWHYHELDNCKETNSNMNVVTSELAAEVCLAKSNELSKSNLIEKACDIKSRNQTKLTNNDDVNGCLTGYKTNTNSFALKNDGNNVKSAFSTKQKMSNFVKDGVVIYDIRIDLERCDQLPKEKVKGKKKETQLNDASEDCQLKDFTKLRSGKVTRREPVLEGSEGSKDNNIGHFPKENRPKISTQKTDCIAEMLEIEKVHVNKKDKTGCYLTINKSDKEVLRKWNDSEMKKLSFISGSCETNSEQEKREKLFETISYKKDEKQERNADSVAIRIESNKTDNAQTFEDQFKTWLGISKRKNGNGQYNLAYTEPTVQTVKVKNGQPENYEELSCYEHFDPDSSENTKLTDSHTKSKGYTFDTNKDSEKNGCMVNNDNSANLSPFQFTQPFDVCQYPETQGFSPELSENHLETPLNETFKHNSDPSDAQKSPDVDVVAEYLCSDTSKAGNILKFKAHFIEDCECKDPIQKDLIGGNSLDKRKKGAKESVDSEMKSTKFNDKNVRDRENNYCLKPDRTIADVSTSLRPLVSNELPMLSDITDGKNSKTLQIDTERVSVSSTSGADEKFTKLLGKSETTKISNKHKVSFLKVKPAQKCDIQRKRKLDESEINGIQENKKLKFVLKESKNKSETKKLQLDNKEKQDNEGMNEFNSCPDSLAEFKCSHKTSSIGKVKATSGIHLEKEVKDIDNEKTKSHDKSAPLDRTQHPIKTYKPRKVFIDGHCFGNKVFWQNFIASPYGESKCISSETKNKSCVEKTNKRKLSLDCSQESQSKDSGYKYQNGSNETVNNKVNTSSESLFSDENDTGESQSNSTSLLHKTGIQTKEYVAKECFGKDAKDENLKRVTVPHNEHEDISIGNGKLRYYKKDGTSRFYRSKQKTNMISQELDVSKQFGKATLKPNTAEKEKDSGHISLDRVLQNNEYQNLNLPQNTGQKMSANKDQGSSEGKSKAKSNSMAKMALKNSEGNSVDKQMFIQDWLLKHREVSKEDPTCSEFSPPEISPTDSSMPSYQPICIKREPEICSEGQILGNNNEKENSSDVTSTSESSSGSESEDSERPLSAAAKYLMKLKTSRKKKMLLAFKSDMSNQAYDYLKSVDML